MTDESENRQQNQPNGKKRPPTSGSLKKGYDPRRWLKGRGPKSPEQREGEEILRTVIWEELSREFEVVPTANGDKIIPKDPQTEIDAMRLMVRSWIKKKPETIADRIAGKVVEKHDVTSDGKPLTEIGVKIVDYRTGITETETGSSDDSKTPGTDKNSVDGS